MDYQKLAQELVRALRGHRSQVALSRRLGYKSNVIYPWESGRRWPSASETLRLARRVRIDVPRALEGFLQRPKPWVAKANFDSPEAVAQFLTELKGKMSIAELAKGMGRNRYAVSRWLSGKTEPSLPVFLQLIDVTSLRLLDFVGAFVDPKDLSATRDAWLEMEARREVAATMPWTQAVLRAMELKDYQDLPTHQDGWIAERLGITKSLEHSAIQALSRVGHIQLVEGRWETQAVTVDTRPNPNAGLSMRKYCIEKSLDMVQSGREGLYSYNIFTVSSRDYERIRELHHAYFYQLRAIIAQSEPAEKVVITNIHLFELAGLPV